jgi:hypothetical protein
MTVKEFQSWFVGVLEALYPLPEAGFAIVMIAFPLLERYLRQKAGLGPEERLNEKFFAELYSLFGELQTTDKAKGFWTVCRNGILHQVTFNQPGKAAPVSGVALTRDLRGISITSDGYFFVNPSDFAKRVTDEIEKHFTIFEGAASSAPPLAEVWPIPVAVVRPTPLQTTAPPSATLSSIPTGVILGTSGKPP